MKDYTENQINDILNKSLDALLVVNSKEDCYKAIRRSEEMTKYIEKEGSYRQLIEKLLFHLNDSSAKITDDYQIFLSKMGEFHGKYSRKLNLLINEKRHNIQLLVYPINETTGDFIFLLYNLDQSDSEREIELENKVKTMQETYLFSMYVDLNKDSISSINVSEISKDDMQYEVKYSEWRMMIVNMIWPEDQEKFLKITDPINLKSQMKPLKTISLDCQMKNLEGKFIWVKLIFGRTETSSEQDFRFVFMVQNIHDDSIKLFNELKKFEKQASHDALTGIYNHGRIETELSNAIEELKTNGTPVSLMMFDIDYFKKVNDTYGHATGDDVLVEFVNTIILNTKNKKIVIGRWGGEEFVCVCYGIELKSLEQIADEIRETIAINSFKTIGHLTCSIGLTQVSKTDTEKQAFIRLDKALYNAKHNGRNCIATL